MNIANIMKDPIYSRVLYRVESSIHEFDEGLKLEGIPFTDSNVKYAIRKVMGILKGKSPSFSEANESDRALKKLVLLLISIGDELMSDSMGDEKITRKEWSLSLRALEDTLKTRREMYGHSRGYLDFLKGFLEKGSVL